MFWFHDVFPFHDNRKDVSFEAKFPMPAKEFKETHKTGYPRNFFVEGGGFTIIIFICPKTHGSGRLID